MTNHQKQVSTGSSTMGEISPQQPQIQSAATAIAHDYGTATEAADQNSGSASSVVAKHGNDAAGATHEQHDKTTISSSDDHMKNHDRGKQIDKKCTNHTSLARETSENHVPTSVEKWALKEYKRLDEVDNGRRMGSGFKASWTFARHEGSTLDLEEPDSDWEAEDAASDGEIESPPY